MEGKILCISDSVSLLVIIFQSLLFSALIPLRGIIRGCGRVIEFFNGRKKDLIMVESASFAKRKFFFFFFSFYNRCFAIATTSSHVEISTEIP